MFKRTNSLYLIIGLVLILLIGFSLRFYLLDQAPKGALIDELHFGYLAHSLNETGMDEHGVSYPVIFKGFGDQKLPAYAYVLMPIIKIMGLSVMAIRIPSLIVGTLIILLSYLFVLELGLKKKYGVLAAFITAISPWPFFLSRIGFESNLALFFMMLGLVILLKSFKQKSTNLLIFGTLAIAASWYSYIAYRPITFGLLLVVVLIYRLSIKQISIMLATLILAVLPLFIGPALGANSTRFSQVGITSDPGIVMEIDEQRTFCATRFSRSICDLVFNKPTLIASLLIDRTLNTYSPSYMATNGEETETFLTVKGFGQFYSIFYPLLILGIFAAMFGKKLPESSKNLILAGLILAPIPSVLAGYPQKVRISALFPFALTSVVFGYIFLEQQLRKLNFNKTLISSLLFLSVFLIASWQASQYFINYYGVHTIKNEWQYQSFLPDMYQFVNQLEEDKLVVIRPFYSDPLMFYAFYSNMSPAEYQSKAELGELEASGFQHTVKLGNIWAYDYELEEVYCQAEALGKEGYLVTDKELSQNPIYEGKSSNGVHTYIYVYDTKSLEDTPDCQ